MQSSEESTSSRLSDLAAAGRSNNFYLTMLGKPKGLAYVLGEQRMAFPATRRVRLNVGDQLLLYTTRNIFGNPSRDRGRVIGRAEVVTPILPLESRLRLSGTDFTSGCELRIEGLTAFGEGVILVDLVDRLSVFAPDPRSWSARLRRSVLALPGPDAEIILAELEPRLSDPRRSRAAYLERAASAAARVPRPRVQAGQRTSP